ncbi:PfkB family carbohydrate kinase [Rhodococcus sp. (in: high G+C Gram-positive bacteria)]|uniref:PfkB family carbohydrate kinase n=1 Tax=Rhodococcus sp. TaxID=1831 RepID=UPI00257AD2F3|nr:PfkB family carbohydrate kinase [Rhodococcus sp. (in: high G+C Gram-positive bacteria)]
MIGAVGDDADGHWLIEALPVAGVNTEGVEVTPLENTATALIAVDASGKNQISVCQGANRLVTLDGVDFLADEAIGTQLEVSFELPSPSHEKRRDSSR